MKSIEQITKQLIDLGLHPTQVRIYLFCLQVGAINISQLADDLGINRVTAHDAVARLIEQGLLNETRSNNRRLIYPNPVSSLQQIVDIQKSKTQQLQQQVDQTISSLQSVQMQSQFLPQIRFAKGHDGVRQVYKEMIYDISDHKSENISDIYIISDSRHFDDIIDNKFLDQFIDHNIYIHLILPEGYEHFIFTYNGILGGYFDSKEYKKDLGRRGAMAIWGDKIATFSYEGIYITTTIIQNKPIHNMMITSRKAIWNL